MAVNLTYKHQQKTYDLMKEQLKKSKKAAYEFPTGCGKSFPGLKYMEDNPDKTVLIIVPSTHIKEQWEKNIERYVEGGKERIKNKNIAIVTYQKVSLLSKKVKKLKSDIIIIDELHRMGAETWEPAIDTLMESQPEAEVIAMTATPRRADKRNMAEEKFGDCIVYKMSLTEALSGEKEGEVVLKSPRYVRVLSTLMPQIREYKERILNIEDEEKKQGLLKKYQRLETIISSSPDIQDIMVAGIQKKNGKYIVFCKDREDMIEKMEQVQEIFGKVNSKINTEYVISKNGKKDEFGKTTVQNRKTLERFESAEQTEELQLLFCVDKLNEGVHIDGIDGEVLFDLTSSPVLYKQRIGRVTTPDKETVIVDAVNNWLTQIDTYKEIEVAIKKGESTRNNTEADYSLLELSPEENELLDILREIGEAFKYNDNKTYEEIIQWLETHDGKMPNSIHVKVKEMTEGQYEEYRLYNRWLYCKERKILEEYVGSPIEEVPEEYREKIRVLREYGLGLEEKTLFEEITEWLEINNGRMPRNVITRNGKRLEQGELTEKERDERRLRFRWNVSDERIILDEYVGRSIEEVTEEYREKIEVLRGYGLGLNKKRNKTVYEEIIEWLEIHEGKLPRGTISKEGKILIREEMTVDEIDEINLHFRWKYSKESKILNQYAGELLEEVPEEYREKIEVLRGYGLGLDKKINKTVYEEIIEWLETHECKTPRQSIYNEQRRLKKDEMTEEERKEKNLYKRWYDSKEKNILDEYAGRPIEQVPEEYREKIAKLRSLGQMGTKKDDKIKSRMKKSVEKKVGDNQDTRQELGATKQVEEQVELQH